MSDLPAPLTPSDCDLRDFQFMPMDIVRLFGSRFHAVASDAEWRAGVTLWLKSFHQVPAASIPDDDVELARLAELGRDVKTWRKLRDGALHGWVRCDDGRYYHPVVAEKAMEAFQKKEFYRERSKKANAKRWAGSGNSDQPEAGQGGEEGAKSSPKPNGEGELEASKKQSLKDASRPPSASQGTVKGQGQLYSDTNVSGADAPRLALVETPPPDPDKLFWDNAKAYLTAAGVANPGAMIGKWIRDHTKPETANAITQAQLERAVDPIPFVQGYFRKRKQDEDDEPEERWLP